MPNKIAQFMFTRVGIPKFENFLNLAAARHKLLAGNVANVVTPGYQSKDIDFKAELVKAAGETSHLAGTTTHPNHIPTGRHKNSPPRVYSEKVQTGELNSVDIEKEISSMSRNELLFTVGATLLQKKFDGLRNAITSK
jgi:flagellar basal-body rod protein FlgB